MTGLSPDAGFVPAGTRSFFPRTRLTQSYCSHPLRGAARSTDFHFGCPFFTSHGKFDETVFANWPIRSQSRLRKSKETSVAFTATVDTGFGCAAYVPAGISARG